MQAMRIQEHEFVDQVVHMDFHHFDHCSFRNCVMVIHAYGGFTIINCQFENCRFETAGAAEIMINTLRSLQHGGFSSVVDSLIARMRQPLP